MCGAYGNFKVQPDVKNFFRPRLNFSNPPTSCTPLWEYIASVLRRASVVKPLRVSALSKPRAARRYAAQSAKADPKGLRESANPKGLSDAGTSEN